MEEVKQEIKDEANCELSEFKIENYEIDLDDELTLSDCSESRMELEDDIDDMWKSNDSEIRNPDLEINLGEFKTFWEWESGRHVEEEPSEDVATPAEDSFAAAEGIRSYKCPVCPRSFTRKCVLTNHQRVAHPDTEKLKQVLEDRPKVDRAQCSLCPLYFANDKLLMEHQRVHRSFGIRVGSQRAGKFGCTACNSDFSDHESLEEHMMAHAGETKYECPRCDATFDSVECLHQHVWEHQHDVDPSLVNSQVSSLQTVECPLCEKTFDAVDWMRHSLSHFHEKPFHCNFCNVNFISIIYFFKHLHESPGSCSFKKVKPSIR